MAEIGKQNTLNIIKEAPQGVYLDGGEQGEILLPGSFVPQGFGPGNDISVFIYLDSEDRLVATTETPKAMVGEFVCLEVVGINRQVGAFLNWGLSKDLLLPFREQRTRPEVGDEIVVSVYLDKKTNRIVASERLARHLDRAEPRYSPRQEVDLIVFDETPMGYKAIVNNAHIGMLYNSELSEPLEYGQEFKGYINKVRPDGKIDLRRDASGYTRVAPLTESIFEALVSNKGKLPYNDKTPPEIVRAKFGVSKKAFKQALGALYKQRRIVFVGDGIEIAPA